MKMSRRSWARDYKQEIPEKEGRREMTSRREYKSQVDVLKKTIEYLERRECDNRKEHNETIVERNDFCIANAEKDNEISRLKDKVGQLALGLCVSGDVRLNEPAERRREMNEKIEVKQRPGGFELLGVKGFFSNVRLDQIRAQELVDALAVGGIYPSGTIAGGRVRAMAERIEELEKESAGKSTRLGEVRAKSARWEALADRHDAKIGRLEKENAGLRQLNCGRDVSVRIGELERENERLKVRYENKDVHVQAVHDLFASMGTRTEELEKENRKLQVENNTVLTQMVHKEARIDSLRSGCEALTASGKVDTEKIMNLEQEIVSLRCENGSLARQLVRAIAPPGDPTPIPPRVLRRAEGLENKLCQGACWKKGEPTWKT